MVVKFFDIILVVFTVIMPENDEIAYTEESSIESGYENRSSDRMEVVQPYAEEPLSDGGDDDEADQDDLTPATLSA